MLESPTSAELIASVARFLRETVAPHLPGRGGFDARVAAGALDIVARELEQLAPAKAREAARLAALLGRVNEPAVLERAFALALREGRLDAAAPNVREHLWLTVIDQVGIDQPKYSALRRALQERQAENKGT